MKCLRQTLISGRRIADPASRTVKLLVLRYKQFSNSQAGTPCRTLCRKSPAEIVPILPISPVVVVSSDSAAMFEHHRTPTAARRIDEQNIGCFMFGRKSANSWFCQTSVHREAVSRVNYSIESGAGFALVQGPDGTGRTSLLKQLRKQLNTRNVAVIDLNAATLDTDSMLWQLADQLAIVQEPGRSKSELLLRVRDELLGRAHCGMRSVVMLDDLHRGAVDLPSSIQYLTALGSLTNGLVAVVATTKAAPVSGFSEIPSISIRLSPLSMQESTAFVTELIRWPESGMPHLEESAICAISEYAEGIPAMLIRMCELSKVVAETSPRLRIDGQVIHELARDVLPRAVA